MPWKASDAEGHSKKASTPKKQETWAKVANKALQTCLDKSRILTKTLDKYVEEIEKLLQQAKKQ